MLSLILSLAILDSANAAAGTVLFDFRRYSQVHQKASSLTWPFKVSR
jgi:hypothetical protein